MPTCANIPNGRQRPNAYTMIEIMVIMAILAILTAIAYPPFTAYLAQFRQDKAIEDLKKIEQQISYYYIEKGYYPNSLADVGLDGLLDPWGNPYQYLRIEGNTAKGLNGKIRKDKNMNPVNTDYDLYSKGPDGDTQKQFTAAKARDDIVRANNGRYYGTAEDHIPI